MSRAASYAERQRLAEAGARGLLDGLVEGLVVRSDRISPEQRERRRKWIQDQRLSPGEAVCIPPDFDPEA